MAIDLWPRIKASPQHFFLFFGGGEVLDILQCLNQILKSYLEKQRFFATFETTPSGAHLEKVNQKACFCLIVFVSY